MNFKKNLTTNLLLFTLKYSKTKFNNHGFEEAYILDNNRPVEDYCLYLKFKPDKKSEEFIEFEKELYESGLVIDVYEPDELHTIFVVKVPKKFHSDLDKFMEGKYSEFSQELKSRMCGVSDTLVRSIVDKDEPARVFCSKHYGVEIPKNQEFLSKPNLKKEILNYEQ
jgi:hypothetical protein